MQRGWNRDIITVAAQFCVGEKDCENICSRHLTRCNGFLCAFTNTTHGFSHLFPSRFVAGIAYYPGYVASAWLADWFGL